MYRSIRFLLTVVLALVLLMGQGFTAFATLEMPCCNNMTPQVMLSCCKEGLDQHEKVIKLVSNKTQTCHCTSAPMDIRHDKGTLVRDRKVLVIGVSHPNPALSLQLSDANSPIWLYWQFDPDQSKLYLEKSSLLL